VRAINRHVVLAQKMFDRPFSSLWGMGFEKVRLVIKNTIMSADLSASQSFEKGKLCELG